MVSPTSPKAATERVLPTLNEDGTRRWLNPKLSKGRFFKARRIVALFLMALFLLLPHLHLQEKPFFLLDIVHRRFTLFGFTFFPTDTVLLVFLMLSIFLALFLFTALLGRVWCGWACPQTVYMEFLFRPIDRFFDGSPSHPRPPSTKKVRSFLKYLVYFFLALLLANTFLAYFVGTKILWLWIHQSPALHPTPFLVMLVTTALVFFDFAFFREQTCLVACPYGRLQSVLLDRRSLIVGYDPKRGEPRGKGSRKEPTSEALGDCIDCRACVTTCPTGIDIRDGLQMECIHCTQCIDACDAIMAKIQKPLGLIRYSSQDEIQHGKKGLLRTRTILYPILLLLALSAFVVLLRRTQTQVAEVSLLRQARTPFLAMPDGRIMNQITVKVTNRTSSPRTFTIHAASPGHKALHIVLPVSLLAVRPFEIQSVTFFAFLPASSFSTSTRLLLRVTLREKAGFTVHQETHLLGPLAARLSATSAPSAIPRPSTIFRPSTTSASSATSAPSATSASPAVSRPAASSRPSQNALPSDASPEKK